MSENKSDIGKRNLSLDCLRIMAMVMVVLIHITSHGLKEAEIIPYSAVAWMAQFVNTFSLVAVNCFVLISSYFLSGGTPHFKKLIPLWIQVWTYSVGVYAVLCFIPGSGVDFSIKQLIRCGLPLLSQQYWFFTFYFLMYLLAPTMNRLINVLDRKDYERLLALLLIVFSVIPSINIFGDSFKVNSGYSLTWFLVLYLIAGYLRKWTPQKNNFWGWGYILPCLILSVLRVLMPVIEGKISILSTLILNQTAYNAPFMVIASTSLFVWALGHKISFSDRVNRFVVKISVLAFGVYLLHDHGVFSGVLWKSVVRLGEVVQQPIVFIGRGVLTLILIFVVGISVEWTRNAIMRLFLKNKLY